MKKEIKEKTKKEKKSGKLPGWAIVLIVVGCLIFLVPTLLIIGSFVFMIIDDANSDVKEDLIIKEDKGLYDKEGTYKVTGLVRNFGDDEYNNIFISYTLYDKDNNILGYATTSLDDLDEGKTWKFVANAYELDKLVKVDHYKLKEITADNWD